MERFIFAMLALLSLSGPALADPFASFYGNSVQVTRSDGSKMTILINQDMTYEQHLTDGSIVRGTFEWKDPQTACFTQTAPAPSSPANATACYGGQSDHKVGDSWTVVGADGKVQTLTLTAGR